MAKQERKAKPGAGERGASGKGFAEDIDGLCRCLDSLLDDMYDMGCGARPDAEEFLTSVRAKYGLGEGSGKRPAA